MRHAWVQAVFLTCATFVIFALLYNIPSANVVMATYQKGGTAFLQHRNPYNATLEKNATNQFKYSPLFAVMTGLMAKVSAQRLVVGGWIFVSLTLFFFGVTRWIVFASHVHPWLVLGLVACVLEVTFSLIVTQANALIVGLLLLGLAAFRDRRYFTAGAVLMLATNLKIYPLLFLAALCLIGGRRYVLGAFVAGLLTFLVPALFVGWDHNLATHVSWFQVVYADTVGGGILDLASTFKRMGLPLVGTVLRGILLGIGLPVFFGYVCLARRIRWSIWLTCGVSMLLLLSSKTEIFTYVLLAPSYILATAECLAAPQPWVRRFLSAICALISALIVSPQFTSSQWLVSFAPEEICRVIGAMVLWLIATSWLVSQIISERSLERATSSG